MSFSLPLVALGILLALAGLVFTLQGIGVVGPATSFMYDNGLWIYGGAGTIVAGMIAIIVGFMLRRRAHG